MDNKDAFLDSDSAYKAIFSHPRVVRDLLQGFVNEPWVDELDFTTLHKLNDAYVADDGSKRFNDTVWRVKFKDDWLYVCLMLEFQSSNDAFMAVRMLSYVALLYQNLIKAKMLPAKRTLPPVLPLVLYNGERHWKAATTLQELMPDMPAELAAWQPSCQYFLLDESHYDVKELSQLQNLVASLIRVEYGRHDSEFLWEELQQVYLDLHRHITQDVSLDDDEKQLILRDLSRWVVIVSGLANRREGVNMKIDQLVEKPAMLQERIQEWKANFRKEVMQQGMQQGIQQGQENGQKLGQATLLQNQLTLRFGELPAWALTRLQEADSDDLNHWAQRIFDAQSLEEFFAQ